MVQLFCHSKNLSLIRVVLILILFHFPPFITPQTSTSMRVYPVSSKRTVEMRQSFNSSINGNALKKLRKLPHVFGKVLELPLGSDADVAVEDGSENIRFIANIGVDEDDDLVNEMRVRAVEIHPGVTKIVVRKGGEGSSDLLLDQLSTDTWRFRLPRSAQLDMASVLLADGKLIVTVPKGGQSGFPNIWRGDSRLVLVS